MGFQSYRGTPFEGWLLPIIPIGAHLSEQSKIEPENIGKIPGLYDPHAGVWSGFGGWTKGQVNGAKAFHIWDSWYPRDQQTIGLQTRNFPSIDLDVKEAWQADVARDVAFRVFGATIVRGRGEHSPRQLLLYRLAAGDFITKYRRSYAGPDIPEFAIEILGKGQQCLIEGAHPKGGQYEWTEGATPLTYGFENIPRIGPVQLIQFIEELDAAFKFYGAVPQKPRQLRTGDSGAGPGARPIEAAHPQCAPSIAELTTLLGFITVNDPELEDYDTWEKCARAIKTACAGDEAFYNEIYLPWQQENPNNDDTTIRAKWESHTDSKVGYDWLCALAGPRGYLPSTVGLFEAIDDDETPDPAVDDPQSSVRPTSDDGLQVGGAGSASGVPGSARPQGALPKADHERVIADRFVRANARKNWIYVPMTRSGGGDWRQFKDGVWRSGGLADWAVGRACYNVCQMIRSTNASQAELGRAQYLASAHAQSNVTRLVQSHPSIRVRRDELDAHPWVMGVPGGHIDAYGQFCPPDPAMLITKRAGVAPDRSVPCPRWEEMVFRLANYDFDTYHALRSAIGYTASGTGEKQAFFFLHGHHAHEGKTTFLTLLGRAMGDYTHVLPDQAMVAGKGSDNKFAFGGVEGCWFIYRGEVEENEEWATSALKNHTGSGMVTIESKGVMPITVPVRAALWFQGNHLPRFRKPDPGLRRRMVVFNCKVGIDGRDEASWLERTWREEGPGIMAWILEAREEYMRHGLFIAQAMAEEKNEYLNTQDAIRGFIEQCLIFEGEASVSTHEVFDQWRAWRDLEGLDSRFSGSLGSFVRSLVGHELCEAHGVHVRKRGPRRQRAKILLGVKIGEGTRDDEADDEADDSEN